jgi:hypothetical protein
MFSREGSFAKQGPRTWHWRKNGKWYIYIYIFFFFFELLGMVLKMCGPGHIPAVSLSNLG